MGARDGNKNNNSNIERFCMLCRMLLGKNRKYPIQKTHNVLVHMILPYLILSSFNVGKMTRNITDLFRYLVAYISIQTATHPDTRFNHTCMFLI